MQANYIENFKAARERGAKLEGSPWRKAFNNLGEVVLNDGAVSWKCKELIALALAIQARCEGCILSHVNNAIEAGVTREELIDALGVCALMIGGPGASYASIALEIYDQFKKAAAEAEK